MAGAVNVLYELDSDLNLLNDIPTGPSQDNSLCAPPQLADLMGGQWCLVDGEEMRWVLVGNVGRYEVGNVGRYEVGTGGERGKI